MGSDELWEKFEDCANRSLPRDTIAPLFERLGKIETIGSVADVTTLLERQDTTVRRMAR